MEAKRFLDYQARIDERGPDCAVSYYRLFSSGRVFLGSDEHVFTDSGLAEIHSLREKAVREDIARRLKRICSNLCEDEFQALVAVMADRQVKRERRVIW